MIKKMDKKWLRCSLKSKKAHKINRYKLQMCWAIIMALVTYNKMKWTK